MPFNGSGVYQPPGTAFPAIAGTLIEAEKFNTIINDIAGALSLCLPRDGQSAFLGNISAGGYMLTNLGVPTVVGHALVYGRPGDGTQLSLNASNLSSGTVPSSRMSGAYTGINQIATTLNQPELWLSSAAGTTRGFGPATSGSRRWFFGASSDAESGSNAGSNFQLTRYDDSGAPLGSPIVVSRATGAITVAAPSSGSHALNGNVTFGGVLTGNGSGLTNLNASNLTSGTVSPARLGLGTPNDTVFLRGDGVWTDSLSGYVGSQHSTNPGVLFTVTSASTGNKNSLLLVTAGAASYRFYDDGFIGSNIAFEALRSGTTPIGFNTYCRARTAPASVDFSSTPTFDSRTSNVFYFGTLTGNVTSMTISNPADGQTLQIRFVQDGTGDRTVALPSGALVSGSINTAPNSVTWLVVTYVASASRWEGTWTKVS